MNARRSSSKPSSEGAGLLVVSPHFDDGVFGCGALLTRHPGACVVTVFGGRPASYETLTAWDAASGFAPGEDVVARRREEDRAALAVLGARSVWLPFRDSQYGPSPSAALITTALVEVIAAEAPATVVIPLGLFHSDHELAREAGLGARQALSACAWLAYAEAIYRRLPGLVDARLAALAAAGITATPIAEDMGADDAAKRKAVACYASQLRALSGPGYPGFEDVFAAELYWRLDG